MISKKDRYIISIVAAVVVTFAVMLSAFANNALNSAKIEITANLDVIDVGVRSPSTTVMSEEEYMQFIATSPTATFASYENYVAQASTGFSQHTASITASGANKQLYDLSDKWFNCFYGTQRISPIFPMALANVETPGRADNSITWSALFPSKYVDISLMETMDVTTVVSDDKIFRALSSEVSTRDRGSLQMSPTYGTGDDYFCSMMTGYEVTKLKAVDTSKYSSWASGASKSKGDRFCVQDVCLRLSSAMTHCISDISRNDYTPASDMQLIAMMAMYHHNSGVWYYRDRSKTIGSWKSTADAYVYSEMLGNEDFIEVLRDYARANPNVYTIDGNKATELFRKVYDVSPSEFASKSIVYTYPIKVLYAYIKLCILYTT